MVGTPPDAFASGVFAHPTPDQKFSVSPFEEDGCRVEPGNDDEEDVDGLVKPGQTKN
jgi:hypothetical protein